MIVQRRTKLLPGMAQAIVLVEVVGPEVDDLGVAVARRRSGRRRPSELHSENAPLIGALALTPTTGPSVRRIAARNLLEAQRRGSALHRQPTLTSSSERLVLLLSVAVVLVLGKRLPSEPVALANAGGGQEDHGRWP
ncbi:MAG: hypothetical protein U1F67_22775 [Rubrivivax sp.]